MDQLDFPKEEKDFNPHLTIGRVKYFSNKKTLLELVEKYQNTTILECQINEFILYESILKKEGPEYLMIEKFRI